MGNADSLPMRWFHRPASEMKLINPDVELASPGWKLDQSKGETWLSESPLLNISWIPLPSMTSPGANYGST